MSLHKTSFVRYCYQIEQRSLKMKAFKNKEDLISAYAEARLDQEMLRMNIEGHKQLDNNEIKNNRAVYRGVAEAVMKYHPHLYRGGWVIPGFGYSRERIGVYITAEQAGDPEYIKEDGRRS